MIVTSRFAKIGAVALATGLHGGALLAVMPTPDAAQVEGMSGGADLRLGSDFADMAAGTLIPVAATEAERAQTPAPADPVQAIAPAVPSPAPAAAPPVQSPPAELVAEPDMTNPVLPATSSPAPAAATAAPPPPSAAAQTLQAVDRAVLAPDTSPRPRPRPVPQPQARAEPAPDPSRVRRFAAPPPSGNSNRNASAGQALGRSDARDISAGQGGQGAEAGNAAASTYPGLVMRQISRAPRPRVSARGTATVAFSVTGTGGLEDLTLARSSGSDALDDAALHVVRVAAPFPVPPAGATRRFQVQITGR